MKTELGKISSVYFGHGGYQDAMLGIHFSFSMNSSGVCGTKSAWDAEPRVAFLCNRYGPGA